MSTPGYKPRRIVILDINALRLDVFQQGLADGKIPHIARLLGGLNAVNGILFEAVSAAPSTTCCCQASSFTGAHPRDHWIPGDDFFDRFGRLSSGKPRRFESGAVDAPDDSPDSLASQALNPRVATIYETAAGGGWRSCVAYNMFAQGAQYWLRPGQGAGKDSGEGAGDSARQLDTAMIEDTLALLRSGEQPELITLYFSGVGAASPQAQYPYLTGVLDPLVGNFIEAYEQLGLAPDTLFMLFSDHGQAASIGDETHTLRVGSLRRRESGYDIDPLRQGLRDHPVEGPDCDALVCPNGGMAHVYVKKQGGQWRDTPRFHEDILPVAELFWQESQDGAHCPQLKGALDSILVRDAGLKGWHAEYLAYTPEGLVPINQFLAGSGVPAIDARSRLDFLTSPLSGDILLFARGQGGYTFASAPSKARQGGLHPDESRVVLAFALPGGAPGQILHVRQVVFSAIHERSRSEGHRQVGSADAAYALRAVMGW